MSSYSGIPIGKLKVASKEDEDQDWFLHSLIEKTTTKQENYEEQLMIILTEDYKMVKHRDRSFGNTLLHHAMQCRASPELVDFLLEEWPEAAKEYQDPSNDHVGPTAKPNYHWMPLHLGAISGAPVETMRMVLEAYPLAAQAADTLDQSLPLHLCIGREVDMDVLELLLTAYPEGAAKLAGNMETPLYKAVAKSKPPVVKRLLEAFPRAVKQKTFPLDNFYPLDMAKERLKMAQKGKFDSRIAASCTVAEAEEILAMIVETKKEVQADFKEYVKYMKKA